LSKVSTGIQEAVVSGQARKKDVGIALGGLLGMGIGAIGGGYESTDIGKVTAAALLDGFNKMVVQLRARSINAVVNQPVAQSGTAAPIAAVTVSVAAPPAVQAVVAPRAAATIPPETAGQTQSPRN
jgi:hypothetical protein